MIKNVLEWLENSAYKYPDKYVYKDINSKIKFSELLEKSKRIGSSLLNIYGKEPVAIITNKSIDTIIGFLGIVYSGHAYAPIDAKLPKTRIETIIDLLKPTTIVCDDDNYDIALELAVNGISVLKIRDLLKSDVNEQLLKDVRNQMVMSDPLYLIFTSGSTGKPKGVITSHQSLICYIDSYVEVMGITEDDVLCNQSPLDYIAAIRDIYIPLYRSASMVITPKEYFMQPDTLFNYMNDNKVSSIAWSVSAFTTLSSLGAFEDVKLSTLNKICFSGSVMPSKCLRQWQENLPNAKFVNQYGPTEATASCTYYVVDYLVDENEQLPIGKAYKHYKVFLLNEDLTPTPNGEVGEICVSGPILALAYYNDPERTNKSFVVNPNCKGYQELMYRTGDYGKLREDGLLEFHGRMDRQIKHMGHRVELDEIEYAASANHNIYESVAIYNLRKEMIYLFYAGDLEPKELIIELRKTLPGFMVPRKVVKMNELPKLNNGKIDVNKLKENM